MENACRWLSTVDDKPGVCQYSIESLRKHIQEDPNNYNTCTLMIDEMSIKKQTTWVPCEQKFVGYVDLGGQIGVDTEKVATNALVIMAVGMKKKWKLPISFHFTAGLSAETLSVLIKQAIDSLHEINIDVKALVMDGLRTNVACMSLLGCNITDAEFSFVHNEKSIMCLLDQVHMVKVLRNVWGRLGEIHGPHGVARWQDIENLVALQVGAGYTKSGRLSLLHIRLHRPSAKQYKSLE